MKALLTVTLIIVGSSSSMFCQTAKPIPPEWLRDGRVVVPEFNLSIGSPNPQWHWTYQQFGPPDNQTAFIAEVAPDTKYVVMVMNGGGKFEGKEKFATGMQKTLPKGWQIKDVQHEYTTVPMSGSSKIRVTIQLPNDAILYADRKSTRLNSSHRCISS